MPAKKLLNELSAVDAETLDYLSRDRRLPPTLREAAADLNIPLGTLNSRVDRLAARDLVERVQPGISRSLVVSRRGRTLLARYRRDQEGEG